VNQLGTGPADGGRLAFSLLVGRRLDYADGSRFLSGSVVSPLALLRITEIPHPRSLKFPTLNAVVGPLKGPPFRWRALRCWR
jgi:hypothetical protein